MKVKELQGLRGLAILLVMSFHFTVRWDSRTTGKPSLYPFGNFFGDSYWLFFQGHLGVQLFFMISGFVIWSTLENSKSLSHFWLKRVSRLWPPLLVALPLVSLVLTVSPALPGSSARVQDLFWSILLVKPQTLYLATHGSVAYIYVTGVLWTLWIEVLFYVLASVVYFKGKYFLATLTGLATCYSLYTLVSHTRIWLWVPAGAAWAFSVSPIADLGNYLWWFIAGASVFAIRKFGSSARRWSLYTMAFACSTVMPLEGYKENMAAFALANLAIFLVFLPAAFNTHNRVLSALPLVFIGDISYELYLLHESIGMSALQWSSKFFGLNNIWVLVPVVALCICLAYLLYRFWSVPACNWVKTRLTRPPTKRVGSASVS